MKHAIYSGMIAATCMTGTAATAQDMTLTCQFETECIDMDGCDATDYQTTYAYTSQDGAIATRTDMSDTSIGMMTKRDGIMRFSAGDFPREAEETLTVASDGSARLVITMADVPMIITYAGACKEQS